MAGIFLFIGAAGGANNGPITAPILLALALSALLATWGAARYQHGPLLVLATGWAGRGVRARRQVLYRRAIGYKGAS